MQNTTGIPEEQVAPVLQPNRAQRRAAKYGRKLITNRAQLTNNRSHPVTRYHVFLKMAHFYLALSGRQHGLTPTV